jgi:hypothetical protein
MNNALYSEVHFGAAYNLTPEEAHRIYQKFGPKKLELDLLMQEKSSYALMRLATRYAPHQACLVSPDLARDRVS